MVVEALQEISGIALLWLSILAIGLAVSKFANGKGDEDDF